MTLRILIIHCAYTQRGGEDSVVEAEIDLLRSRGNTVECVLGHNDAIASRSNFSVATDTFWSSKYAKEVSSRIAAFRPDVVHVHNTFPLVSPSVYWSAARARVPVIQTLHNFRLMCPQAMFLRNDAVCEDCLGKIPWKGVVRGCYRGSVAQTGVLATMVTAHRAAGTWSRKVSRYIALNEFCKMKFIAGGLPADRIVIKPNFVDFNLPDSTGGDDFLFVGRLSREKGIHVLADALRRDLISHARIVGSGPEVSQFDGIPRAHLIGQLDGDGVRAEMCAARALVLPSICYESFPRTLVEAMGCGLPVIASRLGALPELIVDGETGLLFDAGSATDLAAKMTWARNNPEQMAAMGRKARSKYEELYSASKNYSMLMDIYSDAIEYPMSFFKSPSPDSFR